MTRLGLLACVLVCAGTLGAGCAPDSRHSDPSDSDAPTVTAADRAVAEAAEQPPEVSAPQPAPSLAPEDQENAASEKQEVATAEEISQPDERAEAATPAAPDAFAPSDTSGPALEQDEPVAERSVFPPVGDGDGVARWTVEIIEWFPHDPEAFTQGLEVAGGTMYESTGLWGQSSLRTVNSVTGEVATRVELPEEFFGEGLTVVGDEIVQLTWQSETAFVYDRFTLEHVGEYSYEGEGWGLCLSDDVLIMSDGSNRLARRDPETFELLGTVTVTAPGYDGRVDYLNELECVEGLVIANVWQTDRLLVIDPESGRVLAAIDAGPLVDDVSQSSPASEIDVLNGVALDPDTATLWMTGKLWPRLYRVRVVEV